MLESNRMLRDEISERQQIEEALQQSQSRLQLALDAGAIGIWDWDVVNGRIYMDDRLATIFGVDVSQIKAGIPYADFIRAIHHEYQDRVVELIDQTLETGQPYTSEFQIVSGGSFRWVVAHGHVEKGRTGGVSAFLAHYLTSLYANKPRICYVTARNDFARCSNTPRWQLIFQPLMVATSMSTRNQKNYSGIARKS